MKNEKFFIPKLEKVENIEPQELIQPPKDCYFIHGVKDWSKESSIGVRTPEISCSLQKDNFTKPIRSYGYILKLDKGAITSAYNKDVTSQYSDTSFKKNLSEQSNQKKFKRYSEENLEELIEDTQKNSHNELWVNGELVEIIGAYVVKNENNIPGIKAFIKVCHEKGIPIHWIE
ncbi:MAG: hypothetical protein NTZ97_02240 [Candidatus Moranbacteria bacterium]|nr:hypothetical protein [Candidatus Moranbacteria bacterium]